MSTQAIESLESGKIRVDVDTRADGITLTFHGDIDIRDPIALLDPLLEQVHDAASAQGFATVTADFTDVAYMNSAGIKVLAGWIRRLRRTESGSRYVLKMIYVPNLTWQATTFRVLERLGQSMVALETA